MTNFLRSEDLNMVLVMAREIANEYKHPEIYPQHVLYEMMRQETIVSVVAAKLIGSRDLSSILTEIEHNLKQIFRLKEVRKEISYSNSLLLALRNSSQRAKEAGSDHVGCDHFFLAMCEEDADIASFLKHLEIRPLDFKHEFDLALKIR